jgi:hypothetical protein
VVFPRRLIVVRYIYFRLLSVRKAVFASIGRRLSCPPNCTPFMLLLPHLDAFFTKNAMDTAVWRLRNTKA